MSKPPWAAHCVPNSGNDERPAATDSYHSRIWNAARELRGTAPSQISDKMSGRRRTLLGPDPLQEGCLSTLRALGRSVTAQVISKDGTSTLDGWAFGGAAAASRMLQFERGTETVLHLSEIPGDLLERLQAVPATDGPLTILRTPGALAYRGAKPHLAHPLLVYSELLTSPDPHAVRVANALREQFLAQVA